MSNLQPLRRLHVSAARTAGFCAAAVVAATAATVASAQDRTPSPDGAMAYIISPADGATVSSPVLVQFGLRGMGVSPAGVEGVAKTGHHHVLVNKALDAVTLSDPLPTDENHRHFGGGQTETMLDLPPGTHTLQLLLADWQHIPHDPPVYSEPITVTVE